MPRPRNINAIATKANIASAFTLAEQLGEAVIRLPSKEACFRFRNSLYKHRAQTRKSAIELLGINASHLDCFQFTYEPEADPSGDNPTGKWIFRISYESLMEFEILLPAGLTEAELHDLPTFDDIPQAKPEEPEPGSIVPLWP